MNCIKIFSVCTSVFFSLLSFGQNEKPSIQPVDIKKIKITEATIQLGVLNERNNAGSLSDFRTIAPESMLLKNDFSSYNLSSGRSNFGSSAFSASIGIQFGNKEKTAYKNPLLRLGLTYFSSTGLVGNAYKSERFAYDTLTSSQTGQQLFVDSVSTSHYHMNYRSDQLRLDASLLFRTNPAARWSLYGGIGLSFGVSVNSQTDISHGTSTSIEAESYFTNSPSTGYGQQPYSGGMYSTGEIKMENIRNKNNIGYAANIPLGVDFRLGKKREFWRMMHLFCEVRPGVNFISIPDLRTIATPYIQQSVGIKIAWQ